MSVCTGVKMTINGVLDERIDVSFNTSDGMISLRFYDAGNASDTGAQEYISFAAAKQLIKALETAFFMRAKKEAP